MFGEQTLLRETATRLDPLGSVGAPLFVCNGERRFLVAEQVRELGKQPEAILLEPEGRSSASALTIAALHLIVVETADAVLVADKHQCQDVKAFVGKLKEFDRGEYRFHRLMYRPWGDYEGIDQGHRYQVKRLTVKPGEKLSLQMHHHRVEHWVVVSGSARVTRGDDVFILSENESTYIPIGTRHRLENPGTIPLEIIEPQSGSYLGKNNIVRHEDVCNRVES